MNKKTVKSMKKVIGTLGLIFFSGVILESSGMLGGFKFIDTVWVICAIIALIMTLVGSMYLIFSK